MFGQGIGPLRQRMLRLQARAVLPKLEVLSLREGLMSRDLAFSLGARPHSVTVTGDDALELLEDGDAAEGHALGLNMRVASYAGVDPAIAGQVGDVVSRSASSLGVPIAAIPVSRNQSDSDVRALRDLLRSRDPQVDVIIEDLATPEELAGATARCRTIVTGSYHAAVFALGQGVPAVCITRSTYYDGKFAGLRELFPDTCSVVSLLDRYFADRLDAAIMQRWHTTSESRATAREAGANQRAAGREAYRQFRIAAEKTL
jgi:colanic acid/amylovoran biosynthesis protein